MSLGSNKRLILKSLHDGIPVIPEEAVGFYRQNCIACLDSQGHKAGVVLDVTNTDGSCSSLPVVWDGQVTAELKHAYADLVRATEYAACAMALLIVRETTEFTAIEQASRGTTIDYYLGYKTDVEDLIFNRVARLETSGILHETASNNTPGRVQEKKLRLKVGLPALIAVVEFGQPKCQVVKA